MLDEKAYFDQASAQQSVTNWSDDDDHDHLFLGHLRESPSSNILLVSVWNPSHKLNLWGHVVCKPIERGSCKWAALPPSRDNKSRQPAQVLAKYKVANGTSIPGILPLLTIIRKVEVLKIDNSNGKPQYAPFYSPASSWGCAYVCETSKEWQPRQKTGYHSFPPDAWSTEDRYTIMDNDYTATSMGPFILTLSANMTVLGLTGNTVDSWALQCSLHALALLEHGNLSCIPVALGEYYPITMTQARFDSCTQAWGTLDWYGVFAPENLTAESLGNDPTGGNPDRISKSAFVEGYPNTSFIDQAAAVFMVEQEHR